MKFIIGLSCPNKQFLSSGHVSSIVSLLFEYSMIVILSRDCKLVFSGQ